MQAHAIYHEDYEYNSQIEHLSLQGRDVVEKLFPNFNNFSSYKLSHFSFQNSNLIKISLRMTIR